MIKFKLNEIIDSYNRMHPKSKLTVTKISRETGISRHSLQKLCGGKYKQSKGISFDTLNRLIEYFGLPVDSFIKYIPNGIKLIMTDADKDPIAKMERSNHIQSRYLSIMEKSVLIKAQLNYQNVYEMIVVTPNLIPNTKTFIMDFKELDKELVPWFAPIFMNSLTARTRRYIYARVLAHSRMLTYNAARFAEQILVIPSLNGKSLSGMSDHLFSRDAFHNSSVVKNGTDRSVVVDKTTNHYSPNQPPYRNKPSI